MSKVDITLAIIILVGAYGGFRDGFLVELVSFIGILLGVLLGFKFMGWAMVVLAQKFNIDEKALPYIAFAGVFFIVLILVNLMVRSFKTRLEKNLFGQVDAFVGALVGLIRTAFMLSVLLWVFDSLKFHFPYGWSKDSWVLPMVAGFAPTLAHWVSSLLPFFKDVF